MRKYENVDIAAVLGTILEINTEHYKSDFQYDLAMFQKAAGYPDGENNRFLWLSRSSGTECFRERDTFITGTAAHTHWSYYAETNDTIYAYAVEITGTENGKAKGNLYELDYRRQVEQLKNNALPASHVKVSYEDGTTIQFSYEDYKNFIGPFEKAKCKHGNPIGFRWETENEDALRMILRQEQEVRQKNTAAAFEVRNSSPKLSVRAQIEKEKGKAVKSPQKTAILKHKNSLYL